MLPLVVLGLLRLSRPADAPSSRDSVREELRQRAVDAGLHHRQAILEGRPPEELERLAQEADVARRAYWRFLKEEEEENRAWLDEDAEAKGTGAFIDR
jgi:hypothetical protein